jgi:hypothetical protein
VVVSTIIINTSRSDKGDVNDSGDIHDERKTKRRWFLDSADLLEVKSHIERLELSCGR